LKKKKIILKQENDLLQFTFYFSFDDEIVTFTLQLPRSKEVDLIRAMENLFDEVVRLSERLKTVENKLSPPLMKDSTIVHQDEEELVKKWILESKNVTLNLIYKSSVDGNRAANFHSKCDNKGKTIAFIETSNGYRIGGYTTANWDQSNAYKNDNNAFIFSLNKKRKFMCTNAVNAIYCAAAHLCTFGGGHEFYITDGFATGSYSNFKHSYGANDNIEGDKSTYLTGSYFFFIKEVELFEVIIN